MTLLNAEPTDSPQGMAIAASTVLAALLQRLVENQTLTQRDVLVILKSAVVQIGGYSDSQPHDSARFILNRMLKDWGMPG